MEPGGRKGEHLLLTPRGLLSIPQTLPDQLTFSHRQAENRPCTRDQKPNPKGQAGQGQGAVGRDESLVPLPHLPHPQLWRLMYVRAAWNLECRLASYWDIWGKAQRGSSMPRLNAVRIPHR